MPKKILLTGFEAFADVAANPSQTAVEALHDLHLPGARIVAEVLPVTYGGADTRIRELVRSHQPDIVLSLGVAARIDAIHLERVALNLDDASIPDNARELRQGLPILLDGAPAFFSSLPLAGLKSRLEAAAVPVRISNHAGAYLCNHVFYAASDEVARLGLPTAVGFIHVPMPAETPDGPGLTISGIVAAISLCLHELAGIPAQ